MTAATDAYKAAQRMIAKAKREQVIHISFDDLDTRVLATLPPEISGLTRLKSLYLHNTQVSDLTPLKAMTGLETLYLANTQVRDLAPLKAMTELRELFLDATQVSDLAPLTAMTGLQTLTLDETQVTDLVPLNAMTGLRELNISNTEVSDLAPLTAMMQLRWLSLENAQVSDLRPLLGPLRGDPGASGFRLWLSGIPACADPAIAAIAAMDSPKDRALALRDLLERGWQPPGMPKPVKPFLFLSYSARDRPRISDLHRFLAGQSLPLWWDQDLAAGSVWRDQITSRLQSTRAVITFWTKDSTVSKAVIEEAATAQRDGRLVHVRLDDAPLPYGFAETQYIDLRGWDGTASHPQMAKLLQALRDRLDPPDAVAMAQRLSAASPVAMLPDGQRLSPVDTPPHTRPEVENKPDLDQRIEGLKQALIPLQTKAADRDNYQFPADLGHALHGVHIAVHAAALTWYGIEAARDSLHDCLIEHDARNAWNTPTYRDLARLLTKLSELQPLLQPRQVPAASPGAKPPEPDPIVRAADGPQVQSLSQDLAAAVTTPEAAALLNPDAIQMLQSDAALVQEAAQIQDPEKRAPRLRRAVLRMVFGTGAVLGALTNNTIANLLSNSDAVQTLVAHLKPIFNALLQFFL